MISGKSTSIKSIVVLGIGMALLLYSIAATDAHAKRTKGKRGIPYHLTYTNGTESQPFSPVVFVIHNSKFHLFEEGKYASKRLGRLAESGNVKLLVRSLRHKRNVYKVLKGSSIRQGQSTTKSFKTRYKKFYVSVVAAMENSNDAINGFDSMQMAVRASSKTVSANSYDAGVEKNNELNKYIRGSCCYEKEFQGPGGNVKRKVNLNLRDPERKKIARHPGILGVGEMNQLTMSWTDPVAVLKVKRGQRR